LGLGKEAIAVNPEFPFEKALEKSRFEQPNADTKQKPEVD